MGGIFSRSIIIGLLSIFATSIKIQKQRSSESHARSLLNRLNGSSSGATNLSLRSGEASAIEDNTNQSSIENSKFVALSGGVNQSGTILKGDSSGQTATAGKHDLQVEGPLARGRGSNSAVSILNSLGGRAVSTTMTRGGSQIASDDTAGTETRETATINEIDGLGTATTTSDNTGSIEVDDYQALGAQSGAAETNLVVDEGYGNSEIADEHSMDMDTDDVKASTYSSSSGQVEINGTGNAQVISDKSNTIDIMKRLR